MKKRTLLLYVSAKNAPGRWAMPLPKGGIVYLRIEESDNNALYALDEASESPDETFVNSVEVEV